MSKISNKFAELKKQNRTAFIAYICAGDPDYNTSTNLLKEMANYADIIEIGVPFLDPAGDGPIIEESAKRAIKSGMTLKKTIEMITDFRKINQSTPIVAMTYFNPILKYGVDKIFSDLKKAQFDAVLIVDLPLEEEKEVVNEVKKNQLDFIRLIAPNTDLSRAKKIIKNASGFLYQISMLGITGTKTAKAEDNIENLNKLRSISKLPVAIGFGIKNPDQLKEFKLIGFDGVIIGSTFVKTIAEAAEKKLSSDEIVKQTINKIKEFSDA
jgi:tryptophan synthase alpha chain